MLLMAPVVPHMSHVLWTAFGHSGAVIDARWPVLDESALTRSSIQVVVQVNGKVRAKLEVPVDMNKADMEALALGDESVLRFTDGLTVRKVIVIPNKLVNIVAK